MLTEKDCWNKLWGWPLSIDILDVPHYDLRFRHSVIINNNKIPFDSKQI